MWETQDAQHFVHRFVQHFPLGCACYRVIAGEEKGRTQDYVVQECNSAFLTITKAAKVQVIGKRIAEAFPKQASKTFSMLKRLDAQLRSGEKKAQVRFMSIHRHIYRVSAFYAGPAALFVIYEDVQPRLHRKYFKMIIPRKVSRSRLGERAPKRSDAPRRKKSAQPASALSDFGRDTPYDGKSDTGSRDSLTGLYDRRFAVRALEGLSDEGSLPLSIILGDVNGLKLTNDLFGYQAGDEVLIRIARIFRLNCRENGLVARWNGDEFLAILPATPQEEAQNLLHRLERAFAQVRGSAEHISVALGYATREGNALPLRAMLQEAEMWILRKKLLMDQSHRNRTIALLLSVLYEKSAETQEHSERMANHCRRIAQALRLSDEQVNGLVLLAMLHDIGKVCINSELLRKPGPLTEEERREIQRHPEIGYRITQSIPELSQVSEYILAHHEWWNGKGYPNGLSGEGIPIHSRIIAVVDAYDVMITGRSYRPARNQEEVIAELQRCAGSQFDPTIVEVFVALLRAEPSSP